MTLWMFLIQIKKKKLIAANVSAIRDDRAVVFRSTISRYEVENALFKDTDGEGSKECSMFFVEKEMLLVTKFVFEPWRNPTLLRSLCPKV